MAANNVNIYSLNTNGLGDLEKRIVVIDWLKSNNLGITLLQGVHSTEEGEKAWGETLTILMCFIAMEQGM